MNPLIKETAAAMSPEAGALMGAMTLAFIGIFLAWSWYAYAPSRRTLMDDYGRIPLDDGE